ncbi:MAG: ABC transporter permease [Anaerolineales bacterium]
MITSPSEKSSSLSEGRRLFSLLNPLLMIRSFYKHRELIWNLTRRELTSTYQSSFLGALWPVILPLMMLLIYTFVFSVVFQAKWSTSTGQETPPGEFALVLFAGLTPFNFFSAVVLRAPGLILAVPNYVKKVVFPLEILPVVIVGAAFITSLINVGLILIGSLIVYHSLPLTTFLLPLAYIPLILITLGLGWFLSSLGVFVRDVGQAINIVVQVLLFVTPIFYSASQVPGALKFLVILNPLSPIIESFRRILIWNEFIDWGAWGIATLISALVAILGFAWFITTKRAFSDVM